MARTKLPPPSLGRPRPRSEWPRNLRGMSLLAYNRALRLRVACSWRRHWLLACCGALGEVGLWAPRVPGRESVSRLAGLVELSGKPRALAHERRRMEDLPSLLSSSGAGKANA